MTSDPIHTFLITRHWRNRHFLRNLFGPPYLFISCKAVHVHSYHLLYCSWKSMHYIKCTESEKYRLYVRQGLC